MAESTVENQLNMTDQYGDTWELTKEEKLRIQVMKDKEVLQGVNATCDDSGNAKVTLFEAGTYVVTAYVGDDIADATIKASYTLIVDSAKNLIKTLEISDVVKVVDKEYKLSEVEGIRFADNPEIESTLELDYKAYDENKNEVAVEKVNPSEMIWTVKGKNVKANCEGNMVTVSRDGNNVTGTVTVQLHYVPGNVKVSADIPVSCEVPRPKEGTYRIASVSGEDDNIQNTTQTIQGDTAFVVKATDQYGGSMDLTKLYTVIVDDNSVADVTIENGTFTVEPKLEEEKTTQVKVYVTETEILTFTVKAKKAEGETPVEEFETEVTKEEWSGKAELFAKKYYNKKANEILAAGIDKDICYFSISLDNKDLKELKSVKLGSELLDESSRKISVGNNNFIELSDYAVDSESGVLLISYLFVALHEADESNEMVFTVTLNDGSTCNAIIAFEDAVEAQDFSLMNATAFSGENATVEVDASRTEESIVELTLLKGSSDEKTWKHMVLFEFKNPSEYYFTKKEVDNNISYGFTKAENETSKGLGYYPYRYGSKEKMTEYTVASLERYGAVTITIHQKDGETTSN